MLRISNLSKSFPSLARPALDDISADVDPGEFCVILGSNGSGKSTLIKTICGEYNPDSGKVEIDEQLLKKLSLRQKAELISLVSQDTKSGTACELTVHENMVLSSGRGKSGSFALYQQMKESSIAKISQLGLGLEQYIDSEMASLSGGQRQSIATLMAINPVPKILLLDEHTSALDPVSAQKLMRFTQKQIEANKITTLMITHNLDEAIIYGNRLIIMQHGSIVFDIKGADKAQLSKQELLDIMHANDDFSQGSEAI